MTVCLLMLHRRLMTRLKVGNGQVESVVNNGCGELKYMSSALNARTMTRKLDIYPKTTPGFPTCMSVPESCKS